jgi:hypothetical protein
MAQQRGQDLFSRLADRGEDVIGRITEMPGAQRLLESANVLKERVDDLQRRVRGLDALERRVAALERKVDELSKASSGTRARPARAAKKPTTTKRTTSARKPSGKQGPS